jgi:thioredoxin 1
MAKKKHSSIISSSTKPVLVDFFADWCGPCQTLSPIVQQVANEMGDALQVMKVNLENNKHAAASFRIRSIPTIILFYKGNVIWRHTGLITKRSLRAELEKKLGEI